MGMTEKVNLMTTKALRRLEIVGPNIGKMPDSYKKKKITTPIESAQQSIPDNLDVFQDFFNYKRRLHNSILNPSLVTALPKKIHRTAKKPLKWDIFNKN